MHQCIFILFVLVSCAETIIMQSQFFVIINSILKKNNLSQSYTISSCFQDHQQSGLMTIFSDTVNYAHNSSIQQVINLPTYLNNLINVYISQKTKQCLTNNNDMIQIMKAFNITDINNLDLKYKQFATKKYSKLNQTFLGLWTFLKFSDYQEIGYSLSSIGHQIYGYYEQNQWTIRVVGVEKLNQYYGITLSNGLIGAVSSKQPFKIYKTVVGGAYDKYGRGRVDNIIETFSALNLQVNFNGINRYNNLVQQINFKQGIMYNSVSFVECSMSYQYFAVKNLPFAFYTLVQINPHMDGIIQLKNIQSAPDYLNNLDKGYEMIDKGLEVYTILTSKGTTKTGKVDISIASSFILDQKPIKRTHQDWDSNLHFQKIILTVKKGITLKLSIISSIITSTHHSDPTNQAIRVVIRGLSLGSEKILKKHKQSWQNLWKNDIIIEGNVDDQKNVRNMLYHFYAFINQQKSYGLSPMGLSGLGYNGHVFWDMDLWMYPSILLMKPLLAKRLIQYRTNRLQAAKNNAYINGYKGSMFPWQSSQSGQQQTPVWALTGPLQHHITGCVAFAVWNYYCVTRDEQWLRQIGFEVIESAAQFWESRVQLQEDGMYHIRNVVAADQWAQNIDDNAFTNAIAIKTLEIANQARKKLGKSVKESWQKISKNIVIHKFSQTNVTKQYETYIGQPIKQADVNLLAFPLKTYIDKAQIQRDLLYYQVKVPNVGTPAMTHAIFSILHNKLNNTDQAYKFFKESYEQYLKKPFNVFSQSKGGNNPYFLTGAGGVLQSVIFGFGGYDITDNGVQKISVSLPRQWTKLTIKISII